LVERLVLIKADGPEQAVCGANQDSRLWTLGNNRARFVGISELSLVLGELEDACELQSMVRELPVDLLRSYLIYPVGGERGIRNLVNNFC
jgi:hypothetical protein